MVKNFSDCARFQDGGDDFQGSPAMRAMLNVNIEHPLEQTRPTDTHGSRGRWHSITRAGWITFVFPATGNNLRTKLRVGREHVMETNEVETWAWKLTRPVAA